MTYREYIKEVMDEAAPRFDGKDAERLAWMRGHLEHYKKYRQATEEAGHRDWWLAGDERWSR